MKNRKTVLITGGSRGIGRSTAIKFAQTGYRVIITYKSNHRAAEACIKMLEGKDHLFYPMDLNNPDDIEAQCHEILKSIERVDVLVNNAGIFIPQDIRALDYNSWQNIWKETMDTNLTGLSNITFIIATHMINCQQGSIVNVSSRGAFRGEPDNPAYGASKGGLNSFSQSMARKLGKYNISVTAVAPGFVETEMTNDLLASKRGTHIKKESSFNRVATPEEVANTIFFLAQPENKFLSGTIVDVNGASFLRM